MLYRLSVFRPHSSPDPFGATLPPGEGILPPRWGGGRFLNRPYDHPVGNGYDRSAVPSAVHGIFPAKSVPCYLCAQPFCTMEVHPAERP